MTRRRVTVAIPLSIYCMVHQAASTTGSRVEKQHNLPILSLGREKYLNSSWFSLMGMGGVEKPANGEIASTRSSLWRTLWHSIWCITLIRNTARFPRQETARLGVFPWVDSAR